MTSLISALSSGRMLVVLLMGFSSGLPLLLVGSTLKLWLRNENIDLALIGAFAFVRLPYTLKFVWSPFLDRFVLPFLGRRRGWLAVFQIGLLLSLWGMGSCDVSATANLWPISVLALLTAFFSASQDVVIDAYRREILPQEELGLGYSATVVGYRFGMMVAQSLAPFLSDFVSWGSVFQIMAGFVALCLLVTFFSPEPKTEYSPPKTLREAVVEPFREYFQRSGAFVILAFILLFKIGDSLASEMLKPFYADIGFTNSQIGLVAGQVAIWANILGGIVGGLLLVKIPMKKCLLIFGILQSVSTFGFSLLAGIGPNLSALGVCIFVETFTGGMGTAAYGAFMASLTHKKFTATQYALLTSLMGVPAVFLGSTTGILSKFFGWEIFFGFCALAAIPGLLLLSRFDSWKLGENNAS